MNKQVTKRHCLLWARRNGAFLFGFILLFALGLLYLCAGESIPVTVHDQLDYVVPMSELQAWHLGDDCLPELMGGMPMGAAMVGIPGMELFYIVFPPALAFSLNLVFVTLIAYASMYACLVMMGARRWISALAAFMFASLPFYSVYSLSSMGIPMVVCAILLIRKGRRLLLPLLLVLVYALWSSFVWVGYAICFVLVIIVIAFAIKRASKKAVRMLLLLLAMLAVYVLSNFDLVCGVSASAFVSHRVEFSLSETGFRFADALILFEDGQYHVVSNHEYIMVLMVALVILLGVKGAWNRATRSDAMPAKVKVLAFSVVGLVAALFAIALFAEYYSSSSANGIRMLLPESLRSFQLDRFYWLYPTLWYVGAGLSFELVMELAHERKMTAFGLIVVLLVAFATLSLSVPNNNLFKNAKDIVVDHEHVSITWEQFYSEDLFREIQHDLNEREGSDASGYRVGSLGMHPLVPLHNGFYTIDGYSVNYPLEYKHRFAEVIQPELDLNSGLNDYFWGWGSRCYLFSHELGKNYLFGKNSDKKVEDLRFNIDAFKELGGRYILSAVPIENAPEVGLELVKTYTDDKSFYRIWVYEAA